MGFIVVMCKLKADCGTHTGVTGQHVRLSSPVDTQMTMTREASFGEGLSYAPSCQSNAVLQFHFDKRSILEELC